jgi:hypothetical protein
MYDMNRKNWSEAEDAAIREIVAEIGDKNWHTVSQLMQRRFKIRGRSSKQCRERWHNHLDPQISKEPWSREEECLLYKLHKEHGNRWAIIAEKIDGRSDNQVKNHFYS